MPRADKYGGHAAFPLQGTVLRGGGAGRWRTGRRTDNRLLLITPAGNIAIRRGMYKAGAWANGVDNAGKRGFQYFDEKCGDHSDNHGLLASRQLRDVGYNFYAEASLFQCTTFAKSSKPKWNRPIEYQDGSTEPNNPQAPWKQPYPTASIGFNHVSMYSGDGQQAAAMQLPEPVKNVYSGRNATQVPIAKGNAFCADMFDPKCEQFITGWVPRNVPYDPLWWPIIQCDDGDFVYGIASGGQGHPNEGSGITPQSNQWGPHLGFIVLCAPDPMPATGTSPRNGTAISYLDRTNYSKHALKEFLIGRYRTLEAFNAAWGSTYSTFESDGVWGVGNGFLDENGRHTAWLGPTTTLRPIDSTLWKPVIKKDLDDFLFAFADHYFAMCRAGITATDTAI